MLDSSKLAQVSGNSLLPSGFCTSLGTHSGTSPYFGQQQSNGSSSSNGNLPSSSISIIGSHLHQQSNHHHHQPCNNLPPSTLDLSEFPSLSGSLPAGPNSDSTSGTGNNGSREGLNVTLLGSSSSGPGRPYVGIIKQDHQAQQAQVGSQQQSAEFTIHSEDFPALPGSNPPLLLSSSLQSQQQTSIQASGSRGGELSGLFAGSSLINSSNSTSLQSTNTNSSSTGNTGQQNSGGGSGNNSTNGPAQQQTQQTQPLSVSLTTNNLIVNPVGTNQTADGQADVKSIQRRGIQTFKDGRVSNIPPGMVADQFGMVGLLTFIRAADQDQNLVNLALGTDLTSLKLDLNSGDSLYAAFPGPWSDIPLKPHEIDYQVPQEYLINNQIRDKLAPIKLNRYGDDTLFFLFYLFPNEMIQSAAANELYQRDWRFHKDEKIWITRAPGMVPIEKTSTYERGTYYFFDAINWRRVAKEFHLDYDRLETRQVPQQNSTSSL